MKGGENNSKHTVCLCVGGDPLKKKVFLLGSRSFVNNRVFSTYLPSNFTQINLIFLPAVVSWEFISWLTIWHYFLMDFRALFFIFSLYPWPSKIACSYESIYWFGFIVKVKMRVSYTYRTFLIMYYVVSNILRQFSSMTILSQNNTKLAIDFSYNHLVTPTRGGVGRVGWVRLGLN